MDDDGGEQVEPGHAVVLALATVLKGDTFVVPNLDRLARFVPEARAKGKSRGKQPKLSDGQQRELCRMPATGSIPSAFLQSSFPSQYQPPVAHSTGIIPLSVRFCPLAESARPLSRLL